ncbi:hypothetical protein ACFOZ1_01290 [Gracilibacillus marinus]|jgi:hypothetical protein|uniref:Uncharacterized protein n=1 Tax=Gracilibacillus marinus TaxID=630535 RepID=A0ABV8VTC0_9BACI
MKNKKLITLVGASIVSFGLLTACGDTDEEMPAEDAPMQETPATDEEAPAVEEDNTMEEDNSMDQDTAEEEMTEPEEDNGEVEEDTEIEGTEDNS